MNTPARFALSALLAAGLFGVSMFRDVALASSDNYKVDEATAANGGHIYGLVTAPPERSKAVRFQITRNLDVCGAGPREVKVVELAVDRLWGAVVFLGNIPAGKPFTEIDELGSIMQVGCTFEPYLSVVRHGRSVSISNLDLVHHSLHAYEIIGAGRREIANVSQPAGGSPVHVSTQLRRGHGLLVTCDIHEFMKGWVFVPRNPYYSVLDSEGQFRITQIPPGSYQMRVWHPELGTIVRNVEVRASEGLQVEIRYP